MRLVNNKYVGIKSNQGITLIELIIGMAISSIVIGAIVMFMAAGSRGYQTAQSEISLQTEAQTIMNQIREHVLEGNNTQFDVTDKVLTIYHSDGNPGTTTDPVELIWFNSADHHLYLYNTTMSQKNTVLTDIRNGLTDIDNLMGEYVRDFTVTPGNLFTFDSTGTAGTTITVELQLSYNNRDFSLTEDMKMRNRIVTIP